MEQTIINANMEIKDRTPDNRKSIKQTRVKQVPELNASDLLMLV
jgi:hypothetical protein